MAVQQQNVANLSLDLSNFRTVHQSSESHAVSAMISIDPNYFWGLMESLLDGYNPTDNIVVMKVGQKMTVREGNRRVSCLKLIHGLLPAVDYPAHIETKLASLLPTWKTENASVPCVMYGPKDEPFVKKLVARIHATGETAGRASWPAVAGARFGRDELGRREPGLDLLEAYLDKGKNLTSQQIERWSGDYSLTVLDEALQKLTPLLGVKTAAEVTSLYPAKHKRMFDAILLDIGTGMLKTRDLRVTSPFWGTPYGVPNPASTAAGGTGTAGGKGSGSGTGGGGATTSSGRNAAKAHASHDSKSVRRKLRTFVIRGTGRDKIESLRREAMELRVDTHPHAFCFLLRCLFELSAKAYCEDKKHTGRPSAKSGKDDKKLVVLLKEIVNHMHGHGADKATQKLLHGSITEISKAEGILSVTSLNQMVHSPTFSASPKDICLVFHNVLPLLEALND